MADASPDESLRLEAAISTLVIDLTARTGTLARLVWLADWVAEDGRLDDLHNVVTADGRSSQGLAPADVSRLLKLVSRRGRRLADRVLDVLTMLVTLDDAAASIPAATKAAQLPLQGPSQSTYRVVDHRLFPGTYPKRSSERSRYSKVAAYMPMCSLVPTSSNGHAIEVRSSIAPGSDLGDRLEVAGPTLVVRVVPLTHELTVTEHGPLLEVGVADRTSCHRSAPMSGSTGSEPKPYVAGISRRPSSRIDGACLVERSSRNAARASQLCPAGAVQTERNSNWTFAAFWCASRHIERPSSERYSACQVFVTYRRGSCHER
jgi:hypothetical protein